MSCELTGGYVLGCADNVGGIKSAHIARKSNITSYTETGGVISAITQVAVTNFYKYELEKENGMFEENQTKDVANSTNFYEGALTFSMNTLSIETRNNISMLALSPLFIIIEDVNGKYWTMGHDNGADLASSKGTTGQAFGDKSGRELTFSSKEKYAMFEVPQSVVDTLTVG
jgi:hypothetical protein